jgi:hypothetical protein
VGQAGRQFAQRHLERFAPVEIERAARDGGPRNLEARAWQKYQELAAPLDADAIQREVMAALVAYAEALLRNVPGTTVPPRPTQR